MLNLIIPNNTNKFKYIYDTSKKYLFNKQKFI